MLAQVIVARKVLLMSMFQLYDALLAVLLATGLVMISLGIHIFARPFEDAGTDWVEMLTLTSQLFLLVAGPVFKTLVRDRHTLRACRPSGCWVNIAPWRQNNPDNGMDGEVAATFRQGLEIVSAATLVVVRRPSLRPRTLRPHSSSRAPQRRRVHRHSRCRL